MIYWIAAFIVLAVIAMIPSADDRDRIRLITRITDEIDAKAK